MKFLIGLLIGILLGKLGIKPSVFRAPERKPGGGSKPEKPDAVPTASSTPSPPTGGVIRDKGMCGQEHGPEMKAMPGDIEIYTTGPLIPPHNEIWVNK